MRSAALALLLGGCLIVRADEVEVDPPCPSTQPELLADATGPFVLADAIYFVDASGTLAMLPYTGGIPAELTTEPVHAGQLAADASSLYWTAGDGVLRMPLGGGAPAAIVSGYPDPSALAVDDTHVVWGSSTGLYRWAKADETVEMLDSGDLFLGLASYDGRYYYSVTHGDLVRRAPPAETIAAAHVPAALVVVDDGIYYYEVIEPFADHGGALRLVPRDGGEVVTTADHLAPVFDLATDDTNLYFATGYGDTYRIEQVSRFGGAVHTLACGTIDVQPPPLYIASRGGDVYFEDGRGLYRIPIASYGASSRQ